MGFTTVVAAIAAGAKIYTEVQKADYNRKSKKYEAQLLENQAKQQSDIAAQELAQRRHQAQYALAEHENQFAKNKVATHAGSGLQSQLALAARLEHDIQTRAHNAMMDYQNTMNNVDLVNWRKKYETGMAYSGMVSTLLSSTSSINSAYNQDKQSKEASSDTTSAR